MAKNKTVYSYSFDNETGLSTGSDLRTVNNNSNVVKMRIEKNKRGGKIVIVLWDFPKGTDLSGICSEVKKRCGTGGTVVDNTIEIQGDQIDRVAVVLSEKGINVKKSGG